MTLLFLLACDPPSLDLVTPEVVDTAIDDSEIADTGDSSVEEGDQLADAIDEARLRGHLEELARIGEDNGDTRYWTSGGHLDSTGYVVEQLTEAGYAPWLDLHTYEDRVVTDVGLAIAHGDAWVYEEDYAVMSGSGAGDLRESFTAVDLMIPPGDEANSSTSGCDAEDFVDFPAGDIALVQRGSCTFGDKVRNALDAGAVAVLIFNEGQEGRRGPVSGTLGERFDVPVLGLSYSLGEELAQSSAELDVVLHFGIEELTLTNVFAELPGDERLLLVGGHLDSVAAGPGLNDNGSGSVLVLELAIQLAAMNPEERPTVRFAWWDGEEYGLLGSYAYVQAAAEEGTLPQAYFNYDMVASPNGAPFIYDGDGSYGDGTAPAGSGALELALQEGYERQGLDWEETGPYVPTDSWAFLEAGVASSGIFTGAYETLGATLANRYGGDAYQSMDSCYHQLCDGIDNLDMVRMVDASKAAAFALQSVMSEVEDQADRTLIRPRDVMPHDLPHCGVETAPERI